MKKRHLQIIVPLLIVVAVAGLWLVKNLGNDSAGGFSAAEQATLPAHLQDADFSLVATGAVDMAALAQYGLPMIIDYGFESCGPCRRMAPTLEAVNADYFGRAFIKYVDVVDHPDAADGLPVLVYPTQIFVNGDGTPFEPSAALDNQIHFAVYNDKETGARAYTTHQGILTEAEMRLILEEMGVE